MSLVDMVRRSREEARELELRLKEEMSGKKMEVSVSEGLQQTLDALRTEHQQHTFQLQVCPGALMWLSGALLCDSMSITFI
jgi:hypothetical protein